MGEFAYTAKAAAAEDVVLPEGWPSGWPFPSSSGGPWPGGWPHVESNTYTLEITLSDWLYAGGPTDIEVRTLLSAADTDELDGELIKIEADIGGTTVQLKKNSGDSLANQVYFRVTNYSGSKYGFSDSVILDLDSGDDGSTVTITATVVSTSPETEAEDDILAEAYNGILAGGYASNPLVQTFSLTGNTWESKGTLPGITDIAASAMSGIGGVCYIAGGYEAGPVADIYRQYHFSFTLSTEVSAALNSLPLPKRGHCFGAAMGSKTYATGGIVQNPNDKLQDCDGYTISAGTWAAQTDSPTPKRGALGGSVIGTKFYLMAGLDDGGTYLQDCDEFDGSSWSNKTSCPSPARLGPGGASYNGFGYICGGIDSGATKLQDNDQYSQSGDSWASKTSFSIAGRSYPSCFNLSSSICIAGGSAASNQDATRAYDTGTDSWAAKGALSASLFQVQGAAA